MAIVYNHWSSAWYIYNTRVHNSLFGYPFVNGYPDARVPVDRPTSNYDSTVIPEGCTGTVTT